MIELDAIQITNISTMKDGGLKIVMETQEMTTEQKILLFDGFQKIERLQAARLEPKNAKSFSKQLYDLLWVLWDKKKEEKDFEFYAKDFDLYREACFRGYMSKVQEQINKYD